MVETLSTGYQWRSIGGHLALDLCNTVSWRLDPPRRIDRLSTPVALTEWFCAVTAQQGGGSPRRRLVDNVTSAHQAPELLQTLELVQALRDSLIRVLDAHLGLAAAEPEPAADPQADVDRIAAAWRQALAAARTSPGLPWKWTIEPTNAGELLNALALAIGDLMHRPELSGLRRCDGEGCGWLFLDGTRNHSRRWCDSLDCGNRARVRNYAERRRAVSPGH